MSRFNASDVGSIKKDIVNVLGCEITPEANIRKDADELSGKFQAVKYLFDNPGDVNITVHVWLSMSLVMSPMPPFELQAGLNFTFIKSAILKLEDLVSRLVFVAICSDSNFLDEEEYWRGVEEEIGATNRFTRKRKKKTKAKWVETETANLELEPRPDAGAFWLPIDMKNDADLLCEKCRGATSFKELERVEVDPRVCINCSANNQSQYKRTGAELREPQAFMILAARLKVALQSTGAALVDPRKGFKDWLINVAATFVANHGLGYGGKLMKAVYCTWEESESKLSRFVRSSETAEENSSVFSATQSGSVFPAPQDGIVAFRLMKDCGNVMYTDFLTKIINSDDKMKEIFGPTQACTAEKAGDVVEFWLGLLDIAAMTKGTVDNEINPSEFLNCLEDAVRFFRQTAQSTSPINAKRKGSFDGREMEMVNEVINAVKCFKEPDDFHYLTDEALASVIQRYEVDISDRLGGAKSEAAKAEAGYEPSALPAEAEAMPDDQAQDDVAMDG
eukprot:s3212_g11.t1